MGDRSAGDGAIVASSLVMEFGTGASVVRALDNVDVEINENEFFTLLGPSGCGKTTLLRIIAGFDLPTSGVVYLGDRDITALPPHRRPVNTVFQSYALFPHMTVAENVGFGLEMLGRDGQEIDRRVKEMLGLVQLDAMAGRRTDQLSGGQQQRVALARALAPEPKVLLLDEPLAALDLKLRKKMQIELKELQSETGITFIFVTHDQEEALTMSDRIAVMRSGQILQIGAPREIYEAPTHRFVADFIGDINILEGRVDHAGGGRARVDLKSGASVEARTPENWSDTGEVAVAIRPEAARLVTDGQTASLEGILENVVYFGSASNLHLRLPSGEEFVVRHNGALDSATLAQGQSIGVVIPEDQIRVLR